MSAGILNSDTMFSVRETPWHRLGSVLPDYLDLTQPDQRELAIRLAGHDWQVLEAPVVVNGTEVEAFKALTRSDTGSVLNVTNKSYGVIQNDRLWEIAEALSDNDGVKVETAGTLFDGKRLWVLAKIGGDIQVQGDPSPLGRYLCVATAHDGSMAFKAFETTVRVVCHNTLSAALLDDKATNVYTFRHTLHGDKRVAEVAEFLREVNAGTQKFAQVASALAQTPFNQEDAFVKAFIPAPTPKNGEPPTDRVLDNVNAARNDWHSFYASDTCEGVRGTVWGVVQASTEWADYGKARRGANKDENLFSDVYLGGTNQVKATALKTALALV